MTILFLCQIFGYDYETVILELKALRNENAEFDINNMGYLKNKVGKLVSYPNPEYGLIEYFYYLNKRRPELRTRKVVPYQGGAKYIEQLIVYFGSIYDNVNIKDLLAIGAAESGYYKVKSMLRVNNVYGGLDSKRRLLRYDNIELGVLAYVRLMSKNYYGKGLTTIEEIGRVYCPVIENGVAIASPHWLKLVGLARIKYNNYNKTVHVEQFIKEQV